MILGRRPYFHVDSLSTNVYQARVTRPLSYSVSMFVGALLLFVCTAVVPSSAAVRSTFAKRTLPAPELSQNVISSPTFFIAQSFDVLDYKLSLSLLDAPAMTTKFSRNEIRFRWVAVPDSFRFHLRSLTVDSAYYIDQSGNPILPLLQVVHNGDSTSATYHHAVTALSSHKQGDTVRLVIVYSGKFTAEKPVGGYSWGGVAHDGSETIYSLGVGFHNNYVSCGQHWMPCYDLPSDKATFSLRCYAPSKYTVLSNGTLTRVDSLSSQIVMTEWTTKKQTATNLLTFAIGPYYGFRLGASPSGAPIQVYGKYTDTNNIKITFKHVADMSAVFEQYFGPFPFEKIGYVITDNGSMEHQTMISLGRGELSLRDTVNEHVAHEMAHQWFGDLVTPYDYRDAWLCESFATFCESLWMGSVRGNTGYLVDTKSKISTYLTSVGKPGGRQFEGILPLYDFDRASPSSNYPQTIYIKGANVLAMLRFMLGDTVFFASLRDYISSSVYANATIDSLQNAFKRNVAPHLRDSIDHYFAEWVRGKGWPLLEVNASRTKVAGQWRAFLHINQVQPDSFGVYTWFPLELSFKTDAGDIQHRVVIVNSKSCDVMVDSVNEFTSVLFNSGTHVNTLMTLTKSVLITDDVPGESKDNELVIYPNPGRKLAHFKLIRDGNWHVAIVDQRGAVVARHDFSGSVDSMQTLPLSDLSIGDYFMCVSGPNFFKVVPYSIQP